MSKCEGIDFSIPIVFVVLATYGAGEMLIPTPPEFTKEPPTVT
jgi:hypothetical protein